ncbi:MAG: aldo/keto reductase [Planctomycetes bacterium]|nr:aldo/keto reductase [Planctomycetota bacterium]
MEERSFEGVGRAVSVVGLGCWQLGGEWGEVSDAQADAVLDAACDAGITFLDTADVYGRGRSERRIARFLARRGLRDGAVRPVIATKVGRFQEPGWPWNLQAATVRRHVEASLRRLGTDVLDLVQLHCVPPERLADGSLFDVLRELRDAGRIRAFGASVETVREAELCLRDPDCASLQVIYNLLRQRPAEAFFDRARERGVAIIVRLPLASGLLAGRWHRSTTFGPADHRTYNRDGAAFHVGETFSGVPFDTGLALVDELRAIAPAGTDLAAFAQRFVIDHAAVTTVITGATRPDQVRRNAAVAALPPLSRAMHARLARWERDRVRPHVRGHGDAPR